MQIEVLMPKMGESITEGKIIKWYKKQGEKVKRDDVLLEISTDKVDTEIPSAASGVISRILVAEQESIPVGSVIAYIESEGSSTGTVVTDVAEGHGAEVPAAVPMGERVNVEQVVSEEDLARRRNDDRFFSPVVRNIARTEGVTSNELMLIDGTGAGGRITKSDLLRYIETRHVSPAVSPSSKQVSPPVFPRRSGGVGRDRVIPMDNMRQRIMEHMVASRDTSVHVAAITEADMSKIADYISQQGTGFERREGFRLTFMPFIGYAVVKALKDFPLVNSSIVDDGGSGSITNIVQHDYVNLGIAVAIETAGLLVPVIKGAEEKNVLGLARAVYDMASRARSKRLTAEDTIGSTFSITNYGVFGNLIGVPIINQPNVAILGVGAVKKRAVVINDAIAIRSVGFLTLSFDHRLIDGALGGKFLERIVYYLENFDFRI